MSSPTSSSFYWAMRLLPPVRRRALMALYGFCQNADDIADGESPLEIKAARLAVLRGAVAAFYETGLRLSPLSQSLTDAISRFHLPRAEIEAVIDGMAMDIAEPIQAPSSAVLEIYCRRVAGAVGILTVHILGRPDAWRFAELTGEALQLTNMVRDVAEDAARERLYLPDDILRDCHIAERHPLAVLNSPSLPEARAALAERAEERFAAAAEELRRIGSQGLWPAQAMSETYRAILRRLRRRNFSLHGPDPRLGLLPRLWIAIRAAAGS